MDPVYAKLRYTELELDLFKRLAVAYNQLEKLYNGDFPSTAEKKYRNDIWEESRYAYDQLSDAQNFAWDIAEKMTHDLDDEDWCAFDGIRCGDL